MKLKILTFIRFYLPGYKSGGPIRTLANMVDQLSDVCEFWIVTQDRDQGDTAPYANITTDKWCSVGKAKVYYCSPNNTSIFDSAKILNNTDHNIVYFNSFLNIPLTVKPLLAMNYFVKNPKPVVLAPRGEFSKGALQLKKHQKNTFIIITKLLNVYNNITWQASSEFEKQDILRILKINPDTIKIAADLPALNSTTTSQAPPTSSTDSKQLKIIFLSRIMPIKNLLYCLQLLHLVKVDITFDIYGPQEDIEYWQQCQNLIHKLPPNIQAQYCGKVKPEEVSNIFSQYDLFLFPTKGENYGHVIAESLATGTPILVSDQTPWRNLKNDNLGWDISLEDRNHFVSKIEEVARKSFSEMNAWREKVKFKYIERLNKNDALYDNKQLFFNLTKAQSKTVASADNNN